METGFLLIDKPKEWTSHDVVAFLRKKTGVKKIGHAGTLDPFATGLLIVGVGREATKRLDEFKSLDKTYIAEIQLGAVSDTYDSEGEITKKEYPPIDEEEIKEVLASFVGKQLQIPPMYSAKKVKGKKLYELARKGIEIEREPSEIQIHEIQLLSYKYPILKIQIKCSTGTYIRSLAHDIGQKLGCGAYCNELERTKIGDFSVKNTSPIEKIDIDNYPQLLVNT